MTPQQIKAQFAQAQAMIRADRPEEALSLLKTLLMPSGGAPEIRFQMARALDLIGDTAASAAALDEVLKALPGEASVREAAIRAHTRLGNEDRVRALYDEAIKADPKTIKPRADKAQYLQQIGDFDGAETILRRLLKQSPQETELYRMLVAGLKLKPGDPLVRAMRKLWTDPRLNDQGRMQLGFALAKAAEDAGETDRVFGYLDAANTAQARLAPFDAAARDAEWAAYARAQDDLAPPAATAPLPLRPVFVTGMPRSGTTLVEQIIGAHSRAVAGGEMGHALREAVRLFGPTEKMKPLSKMGAADLDRWAMAYRRGVRRDTGAVSGVVTDKSIRSQLIFGLIAKGLPGARIIVVHRDPRDIALSIYKNHFRLGTHRYANDLGTIAAEIRAFRAQVDHWRNRLPGQIHEIRYEDLVADAEAESRRLIAAAGLDWEDACLTFHKQAGKVKTLSLAQVRQPIHAGRREAWRKYETELAPFLDAWGDEPWD